MGIKNRMIHCKEIVSLIGILCCLNACVQNKDVAFNEIYSLIDQENFFKAKELYASNKNNLSKTEQNYTESVLDNTFNRLEESEKKIDFLFKNKKDIPDSLMVKLYEIKGDNALKLYHYKEASKALLTILNNYKVFLSQSEIDDHKNDLKLWSALENVPPQKVVIRDYTNIKMTKDIAGINNLKVSTNNDTINFIFDTGANLSTTSKSVAKRLGMKMIQVNINVGSSTGKKVLAQLAVCKKLTLGNADVYNAIFLVVPDDQLSFPQDNYQIYGILGFPVIEAFKEVRITQSGRFIIPKEKTTFSRNSNLAMDGLMPLICIDGKHFGFDTGADNSMLYHKYYVENRKEIDKKHQSQKVSFAGVGGVQEFDGFVINHTFNILGKEVTLKKIILLKDKIKDEETSYGNIGQDLIRKFDIMILNFDQMFIKFE